MEEEKGGSNELVFCDICYEEVAKRELFGLSCQHLFCTGCLSDHLESNIKDGNVTVIPCMQLGCEVAFEDSDVQRFGDDGIHKKYQRFQQNVMVDLDPKLRWCPRPGCEKYLSRNGKKSKATCECKTVVCMKCGRQYSEGHKCGQSDEERLFERFKLQQGGK